MTVIKRSSMNQHNRYTVPSDRPDVFEVLQVKNTGASERGSTYYKTLLNCPREFALSYLVGISPTAEREALTMGWLFHHCLELYYKQLLKEQTEADGEIPFRTNEGMKLAYEVVETLDDTSGYTDTSDQLRRMLDAYFEEYDGEDRFRMVAIEETIVHRGFEYSARLDNVLIDERDGFLYIQEHKTARSITEDLLDSYQLDLQILGQVWLILNCIDLSKYPPFHGVKINIVTKQKTPRLTRLDVMPSRYHLQAFEDNLLRLQGMREAAERLDWPMALGHCAGFARGYSKCQYYELCHAFPTKSVADWKKEKEQDYDPPYGFKWKG